MAGGQTSPPGSYYTTPYGPPINLETAKKAAAAALAEAARNSWMMTVAIVDPSGNLVYYERTDNCQWAGEKVAIAKARSAARYKRPTQVLAEAMAKGAGGILALDGAVPLAGGLPLLSHGKIIGAIGVSGDAADNDAQCARAAVEAVR